jgi:hypothetical protein
VFVLTAFAVRAGTASGCSGSWALPVVKANFLSQRTRERAFTCRRFEGAELDKKVGLRPCSNFHELCRAESRVNFLRLSKSKSHAIGMEDER